MSDDKKKAPPKRETHPEEWKKLKVERRRRRNALIRSHKARGLKPDHRLKRDKRSGKLLKEII